MEEYQKLLLQNKAWAHDTREYDEDYFVRLAASQTPHFLWIGCSDSRVSTDILTDTAPGEMFVHRNIANLVVADDLNLLSVVQYAVDVLKVKHIIVCGHYGCGGVKTAMTDQKLGLIDQWLIHIKRVKALHQVELNALPDDDARADRLVELNTIAQVHNLAQTDTIRGAWQRGNLPALHGWVFDLSTGLLKQVLQLSAESVVKTEQNRV